MSDTDVAFRTNIITIEGEGAYEDMIIKDHSAGDITTEEAAELIKAVNEAFADETRQFHTGVSYRHCLIVHNGETEYTFTPPHDVLDQRVGDHLPKGPYAQPIIDMMKASYEILNNHPVNAARREKGLRPANTLWIWGQGKKPQLSKFYDKYGLDGTAISAVDLIKGIAICAGLKSVDVEGATGTLHTNFEGKAEAAIREFRDGKDFVYMHLEGPDECSHQGSLENKIKCAEYIDQRCVKHVVEHLKSRGERFKVLVVPDHRTPLSIRTHSSDPVPYLIYDSENETAIDETKQFNEKSAYASGIHYEDGYKLTDYFFSR
jgi:2,3-bisphosphoglycerate-independent phosphoglycerate mutase